MTRHGLDAPDVLVEGSWQLRGGVQVWVEGVPPIPETPIEVAREEVRVALLIACPRCAAKVSQTCRSTGGNPTSPHKERLAPRLCPCGARVAWKKQMCSSCAIEARRQSFRLREIRHPTRMRRRAS